MGKKVEKYTNRQDIKIEIKSLKSTRILVLSGASLRTFYNNKQLKVIQR